jgi:GH15 family glucan-1,4-alpha-glucosidase
VKGEARLAEFPPHALRDYAFLADGMRGALCGPRGDICWLCAPRWDSDAICSTLVGGPGVYAVTPKARFVWGGSYQPGTLIWRHKWTTADSFITCRDALAYPGDPERLVLLRRVEAHRSDAEVRVVLDPRDAFGRRTLRELRRHDDGTWTGRTGDLRLRWTGGSGARTGREGGLELDLHVPAGESHDLVLEVSTATLPDDLPDPDACWAATEHSWRSAVPSFEESVAPRDTRHAYAVLRGMTREGGGMVAAATLGMPERAEAGRNYDYRYVWLRDQAFTGIAAAVQEAHPLLDDAVAYATARVLEHGDQLAPAYRLDGSELPHEHRLKLPGYPGGRDIVGNWVHGQFQLDALGELLTLFSTAARHDHLDTDGYSALMLTIDTIDARWTEPEAGIWELDNEWWTYSRLACVAGLRAAAAQLPAADATRPAALADAILAETSRRCLHPEGFWQRSPKHQGIDASLVLPPVRGALSPDDPRTVTTIERVRRDLAQDGYVYRFSDDDRPLGDTEGAFLLCGFAMALATWQQGDQVAAFRWFERTRSACGAAGLFTEEYDVRQRQLRGNLPQAFVHGALLECAQRLSH